MIRYLCLLLFLPISLFSQQYLRPDGNILTLWTSATYTSIDEVTPNDADYASDVICGISLAVRVYEGSTIRGTWSSTVGFSFATYSFTFNTPTNSNDLSIRFTATGNNCEEEPVELIDMFQVSMSNPSATPGTGTYTCRFRAQKLLGDIGEPDDLRVSWAEIEVPSGTASTNIMIFGDK